MRRPEPRDYPNDYDSFRDALAEYPTDPYRPDAETPEEARQRMAVEDEIQRQPIVGGVVRK